VAGDPLAAGAEVERALYEAFLPSEGSERLTYATTGGASSKDYKAKFRTLSFNLKDAKNPDLRRAVLNGQVAAADLLSLSAEELVRHCSLSRLESALSRRGLPAGLRGATIGQPAHPRARYVGVRARAEGTGAQPRTPTVHVADGPCPALRVARTWPPRRTVQAFPLAPECRPNVTALWEE
jgi:hypothetical protein